MAREVYREYFRVPSSNFIVIFILFHHMGLLSIAHCSWLSYGKLQNIPHVIGPRICDQMSLVPKQKRMCLDDYKVMTSVVEGVLKGIGQCQYQFQNERWNCSTLERGQPVFGKVINRGDNLAPNQGSREASFVHSVTTAGVMHSVIRACSRGDVNSCSCDRRRQGDGRDEKGRFKWGGCSDDVKNGTYFAREFMDAQDNDVHDARAEMNLHNNNVGRRAVKRFVKTECQCHGSTASCLTRTCWQALGDFRMTGHYLKSKYDTAIRVTATQNGANRNLVSAENRNDPSKNELVFLENSPNYCRRDEKLGTFGTAGRECNKTSEGNDGCEKLCCGRGYITKKVEKVEDCLCRFHWCCEVKCEKCTMERDVHTCRGEDEFDINSPSTTELTTEPTTESTLASTTNRQKKHRGRGNKRGRKRNNKGKKGKGNKKRKKGPRKRDRRDLKTLNNSIDTGFTFVNEIPT